MAKSMIQSKREWILFNLKTCHDVQLLIWLDAMHLWEDGVELSRDFQEKVWSLIQEDIGICIRCIGIFTQLITAHKIKVTGDWYPWRKFHAIGMSSPCRQAVQRAAVSHHIWRELASGLTNCIKLHTANLRMLTHNVFTISVEIPYLW